MQCDDDCGECCGMVMCNDDEYRRIAAYAKRAKIKPKKQGTTCPFYQNGKCSVYPVRPAMCRLYGHVPGMECPRGYNVNVGQDQERDFMDRYVANFGDSAPHNLHEFCYSAQEIIDLLKGALKGGANAQTGVRPSK